MNDEDKSGSTEPRSAGPPDTRRSPATLVTPEAREAAIRRLSAAFEQDYLSAEELEGRVTDVYRASSEGALAEITADLPATAEGRRVGRAPGLSHRISSVLSNVERGGGLDVPAELNLRSTMGNIELDLRDGRFQEGVTEIRVRAVMGNIELVLPAGLEVECGGRAFLGHFAHRASRRPTDRGPSADRVVLLTGWAILGNVEVRHVPSTSDAGGPGGFLTPGESTDDV